MADELKYLLGTNYKDTYAQLHHIEERLYREHAHICDKADLSREATNPLLILVNIVVSLLETEDLVSPADALRLQRLSLAHSPFNRCCVKTSVDFVSPENRQHQTLESPFNPAHQHVSLARYLQLLALLNKLIQYVNYASINLKKRANVTPLTQMYINYFLNMALCLPAREDSVLLTKPNMNVEWRDKGEVSMAIVLASCQILKSLFYFFHCLAAAIVASISDPVATVSVKHAKARLRLHRNSCWPVYLLNVMKIIDKP
ncbi:protein ORF89 [Lake sturgeon herpesvirus]|nr:protein ORF89 [Lake sturgeon herpesvirus]